MTPRAEARLAAWAALAATLGDLLMLWVGNASRPELGLPSPPAATLAVGAALGVLGIPLYALGYRAAARLVAKRSVPAGLVLSAAGFTMALLGAVIHGYTGWLIAGAQPGTVAAAPVDAIVASGPLLVGLWIAAGVAVLVASLVFAWHAIRQGTGALRTAGVLNPAVLTVLLAVVLAGVASPLLQAFLLPAAPNVAHLAFFLLLAIAIPRR
jgi:hypothetical protein